MFRNEPHWICEAQHRNNSQRRGFVEHGKVMATQRNAERLNSKVLNCNGIAKG